MSRTSQFSYPMNIIETNSSLIPLVIYLDTFELFPFKSSLHATIFYINSITRMNIAQSTT